MAFAPVLINVLNIDLCGAHLQQGESVYASVVGIVWLGAIVHPLNGHLRLAAWRVVWETAVTQTDRLYAHLLLVSHTQMLMTPEPAVDLFRIQKWLHAAQKMAGIGLFIGGKELMMRKQNRLRVVTLELRR